MLRRVKSRIDERPACDRVAAASSMLAQVAGVSVQVCDVKRQSTSPASLKSFATYLTYARYLQVDRQAGTKFLGGEELSLQRTVHTFDVV